MKRLSLTTAFTIAMLSPAFCQASQIFADGPYLDFQKKFAAVGSRSEATNYPDDQVEILVKLNLEAKILTPKITKYAKSKQRTAEVLECLASLDHLDIDGPKEWPLEHQYGFSPSMRNPDFGAEVVQFRKLHSALNDDYVVIHKIPLSVLLTHKDIFSPRELTAANNLIAIPTAKKEQIEPTEPPLYVSIITEYYSAWNNYLMQPKLSRRRIVDKSKQLRKALIAVGAKDYLRDSGHLSGKFNNITHWQSFGLF